jgi:hypothetical protein
MFTITPHRNPEVLEPTDESGDNRDGQRFGQRHEEECGLLFSPPLLRLVITGELSK